MLLEFLVVSVEIAKLVWKDVSVWHEIEILLAKLLLHADHIVTQSIFSSDFIALREMVDLLVLIEPFIEVALAAATAPKDVPFMALS